ncbi:MAG: hypothetical protein ACFFG0_17460 [Candidatus Thorarchaeota archaeon]
MRIFFLIVLLSFSSVLHAISSHLFVGGNYTYLHFKSKGTHSFHGNLGGTQASYKYMKENSIYEAIKFTFCQGDLNNSTSKRKIRDFDNQGHIGYTLKGFNFLLTSFTGFGWRHIQHNLKQTGEPSIKFFYNEIYIPVGIYADFFITPIFSIGISGMWMPQVFSLVNIKPIGNTHWKLEKRIGNVMIELPMTFSFTQKKILWKLQLNPFFQYWQDGSSIAKTTRDIALDLPRNIYKLLSIEVNLGCSF